ncbi:hypothetical protein HWV62_11483 [Athelia sp. TMB]|nr:hypothetical protein HWV62_11483 [Athelia sp. TMB]
MPLLYSPDTVFGPSLPPSATYMEIQAYRRTLGLPGPVDRWLLQNTRTTHIAFLADYLMLHDVHGASCVNCVVEMVRTQVPNNHQNLPQPDKYTLYITAVAPPRRQSAQSIRSSPRAVLEIFWGSPLAINAPEWTRWANPVLQFQQPRAEFAALFARMAFWKVNRDYPELALEMVRWAHSITVPSWTLLRRLQPQTPPSSSPPPPPPPVNRRLRRRRSMGDVQGDDQSTPTRPRFSM